jgi:hypothetical protein
MERTDLVEALAEIAPDVMAPIVSGVGLTLSVDDDGSVTMASGRCSVRMEIGTGHLPSLDVSVAGGDRLGSFLGFGLLLDVFDDPRAAFTSKPIRTRGDLRAELERVARLLTEWWGDGLKGQFSRWREAEELAKAQWQFWRQCYREGGDAYQVWAIKDRARAAFGQEDFDAALSLWESVREHLTPAEARQLEHARERRQRGQETGRR